MANQNVDSTYILLHKMAKNWSQKIQVAGKSKPLVQNCPFSRMLTLKCMVLIGETAMGVWPPIWATPTTIWMVNHYSQRPNGGYICVCLYLFSSALTWKSISFIVKDQQPSIIFSSMDNRLAQKLATYHKKCTIHHKVLPQSAFMLHGAVYHQIKPLLNLSRNTLVIREALRLTWRKKYEHSELPKLLLYNVRSCLVH